jgi:hypothetical protein
VRHREWAIYRRILLILSYGQTNTVQAQPVPKRHGSPLGERSDVASQAMRFGPGLPCKRQPGGKFVVWTAMVCVIDRGL